MMFSYLFLQTIFLNFGRKEVLVKPVPEGGG